MSGAESAIQESLDTLIVEVERTVPHVECATSIIALTRVTREIDKKVDRGFARVDERFNRVDERFDRMDERFAGIDQRLAGMDQRFDRLEHRMETRFGLVEDQLRSIDARIERLVGYIVRDELPEAGAQAAAAS